MSVYLMQHHQAKTILFASMLVCTSLVTITALSPRTLSSPLTTRGGWTQQSSGTNNTLNGVIFVCLNRGAICGNTGTILNTGNGGNNWTAQSSGVNVDLYDISYYWYNTAVAVGQSGTILFTNNSGQTWTIKQTDMMETYYAAQMLNDTFGVAVGVNTIFQPFVTWTNDAWTTWDSASFYFEHDSTMYEGKLTDVYFLNATYGYVTGTVDIPTGGAIARTTDGGNTWETIYFSTIPLYGIDITQSGNIYACGEGGAVIQSLDAGQTWSELTTGVTKPLNAIDFPSDQVGFAVGNRGIIIRTADAGATWTIQTSGVTNTLNDVSFMGESFGTVVGDGGVILHTSTGGTEDDITPPETTCSLNGTMEGGVYTSDVTVTLTAVDNQSGVAGTSYVLDNGNWTPYEGPFTVTANGNHIITFHSSDNAGNVETDKTSEFTIQKKTVEITINGGLGFHVSIKNVGTTNITDEPWSISLTGGFILFGKSVSGQVTLQPGEETVAKDFVIGLGKTQAAFTLGSATTSTNASVFLFFVTTL